MFKNISLKKNSGTTLIELMVVVTILSLIILGLVTFFSGSTRSWISGQNQLQAQREARMALDRMVKEIRMANNVVDFDKTKIVISFPEDLVKDNITFHLDTNGRILENNSHLISHIPSDGFVIEYFNNKGDEISYGDYSNRTQISKTKITLIVDVDNDNNPDITLKTEASLRNYGMK